MEIKLEQNIDFALVEPTKLSFGKRYLLTVNGESIGSQVDRIDLKNFLRKRFSESNEMLAALEEFKAFLIDFSDGSIELLDYENIQETKNTYEMSEKAIKKLNKTRSQSHVRGHKTYGPQNRVLNQMSLLSTEGENLWKNLKNF